MQINSVYETRSFCDNMSNDFQYIYFVSGVMRLIAARWRAPRSKKQGSISSPHINSQDLG